MRNAKPLRSARTRKPRPMLSAAVAGRFLARRAAVRGNRSAAGIAAGKADGRAPGKGAAGGGRGGAFGKAAAAGGRRRGTPFWRQARRPAGRQLRCRAARRRRKAAALPGLGLPGALSAAAVVSARNEESTIGSVIDELKRLPLQEIVVVLNGSTDGTLDEALKREVTIVHIPEALGHDVGRAIGAKLAQAQTLLFVDGDFPVPAERLAPFLRAVHRGADLALNDLSPFLGPFRSWDGVTRVKALLNRSLGRPDLGAASLTSVPHALSRRAVDTVGAQLLAVPPAAQAAAMLAGLAVCAPCAVDVIGPNRRREGNTGQGNPVARLIVGDHLEAIGYAAAKAGPRGPAPSRPRTRPRAP